MESALDLLELERVKEEYARLERRGIPMSVREWYERKLAELRRHIREERRGSPGKRLGELLMERGLLTEEELRKALFLQQTRGRNELLGEILLSLGIVQREVLSDVLREQMTNLVNLSKEG